MQPKSKGCGTRFDRFSPNQITDTRARDERGSAMHVRYNHRFCETCQRYIPYRVKPGTRSNARKGWKCSDCRNNKNG
jgi:hypothetical protein